MTPCFRVGFCVVSSKNRVFALLLFLYWFAISQLWGQEITRRDQGENLLDNMDEALHLLTGNKIIFKKYLTLARTMNPYRPIDCQDVLHSGSNMSGIYTIWPTSRVNRGQALDVFCDMDTDGGGWTVLQRHGDFKMPEDFFNQEWEIYKRGFGDLNKEFWLGNDNIFALTNQRACSVRFDLESMAGEKRFALYDYFWIDDEDHKYTLHINVYSGDAGDSMTVSHNMKFSTKDQDNDPYVGSCASAYKVGWWFNDCYRALLNGFNERNSVAANESAIKSVKASEFKIRPKKLSGI